MDPPVKEASSHADSHIAHYHRLLALVQVEWFFKLAGARVEATKWLAWAHFVRWVLVGYAPIPKLNTTHTPASAPSSSRI